MLHHRMRSWRWPYYLLDTNITIYIAGSTNLPNVRARFARIAADALGDKPLRLPSVNFSMAQKRARRAHGRWETLQHIGHADSGDATH